MDCKCIMTIQPQPDSQLHSSVCRGKGLFQGSSYQNMRTAHMGITNCSGGCGCDVGDWVRFLAISRTEMAQKGGGQVLQQARTCNGVRGVSHSPDKTSTCKSLNLPFLWVKFLYTSSPRRRIRCCGVKKFSLVCSS